MARDRRGRDRRRPLSRELAASTRVLATTVGPYRRYGIPVVEACARAGTHYADLTGEVVFVRESIDRFDAPARESGARIVHSCGFDSIPSDLGVLLPARGRRPRTAPESSRRRRSSCARSEGGVSGGTARLDEGRDRGPQTRPGARALMDDPYGLSPDRAAEPDLGPERDLMGVERDELVGGWVGPFVMAQLNTRVVRRSNALRDWDYGRRMRYREVHGLRQRRGRPRASQPARPPGSARCSSGCSSAPPTRCSTACSPPRARVPASAPASAVTSASRYTPARPAGATTSAGVSADGDPGYKATSVMFGESALALAFDAERLPQGAGC